MKPLLLTLLFAVATAPYVRAQSMNQYQWKNRLVLIFTPSPDDPNFQKQFATLNKANDELEDRRLKIITLTPAGNHENTGLFPDEATAEWYYDRFAVEPYQMEVILVGLDGYEKLRATNRVLPASVILNTIDEMPMRRREILRGYGNKSRLEMDNDGGN